MSRFKYSVSIPHFNSPELLARMLESIPEREDIQLIVVDDGSSPENVAKLKTLTHRNLELVLTGKNRGGGFARNEGLSRAVGEWFISVDSDDFFSPGAFDVFDNQTKTPGLEVLYFSINVLNSDLTPSSFPEPSRMIVDSYVNNPSSTNTQRLLYRSHDTWNRLVNMEFIRKNGIGYENCRINIDVKYALSIGLNVKHYKVLPDKLYNLVRTDDSITRKKRNIEREFEFYFQVQKRNGVYARLKLYSPRFYRFDIYYVPHILLKHGPLGLLKFLQLRFKRRADVREARRAYLHLFRE